MLVPLKIPKHLVELKRHRAIGLTFYSGVKTLGIDQYVTDRHVLLFKSCSRLR